MANARFFKGPAAPPMGGAVAAPPAGGAVAGGDGLPGPPAMAVAEAPAVAAPPLGAPAGPAAGPPGSALPAAPPGGAVVPQAQSYSNVQDRVVQALLRKGAVTPEVVHQAEEYRRQQGGKEPLWRALAGMAGADRDAVFEQAAITYAFRIAPVKEREPEVEFAKTVLESFGEEHRDALLKMGVAPYAYAQDQPSGILKLIFITEDPMRPELQRTMHALQLERFELCFAPGSVVKRTLDEAFPRKNVFLERLQENDAGTSFDLGMSFESGQKTLLDEEALEDEISRSSLINLVEAILVESVRLGASDIHIYPNSGRKAEVHFRVDGKLAHWHTEEKSHPEALLAVIKDNSTNVDRFERDAAQDGFIQRRVD
ncbi:MAG TPA: hypothetical protein VK610_08735, partial [Rhodothermales bacterium]|nr:hypothetical protein [Rhodothermales bacterium]